VQLKCPCMWLCHRCAIQARLAEQAEELAVVRARKASSRTTGASAASVLGSELAGGVVDALSPHEVALLRQELREQETLLRAYAAENEAAIRRIKVGVCLGIVGWRRACSETCPL